MKLQSRPVSIGKLFPVIGDDTIFHRYPNGQVSIIPLSGSGARRITSDVYEALTVCTGLFSAEQLADSLVRAGRIDEREEFYMFIAEAEIGGFLTLCMEPKVALVKHSGSFTSWLPERAMLELTERCNMACEYCYGSYGNRTGLDLPISRLWNTISLLRRKGVHTVELSGGEPTIHPEFVAIFEYCLKEFRSVGLLTNGVRFCDRALDLAKRYKTKLTVQISIDGSREDVNAKVRKRAGTFERTLNTIKSLVAIGVPMRVGFVATANNINDVIPTCELLRGVGVKQIALSAAYSIGRGVSLAGVGKPAAPPCAKPVLNLFDDAYRQYADVVLNPTGEWARKSAERIENCGAGCKNFVLSANGDVKPCPILPPECGTLGNLFTDDYDFTFNDSAMARTCQAFAVRTDEPACSSCKYNQNCGKCLARVFLATKHRKACGEAPCEIAQRCSLTSGFSLGADFAFEVLTTTS